MDREAQKRWDKDNMVTITCRITKRKADEFKAACDSLGTTRNAVLLNAINRILQRERAGNDPALF